MDFLLFPYIWLPVFFLWSLQKIFVIQISINLEKLVFGIVNICQILSAIKNLPSSIILINISKHFKQENRMFKGLRYKFRRNANIKDSLLIDWCQLYNQNWFQCYDKITMKRSLCFVVYVKIYWRDISWIMIFLELCYWLIF